MAKKVTRTMETATLVIDTQDGKMAEVDVIGSGAVKNAAKYVRNVYGKDAVLVSIKPGTVKLSMDEEKFIELAEKEV